MEFKAHVFNIENEAINAISLINTGENIPRFEDSETTTYCDYSINNASFYIRADNVTRKYIHHEQIIYIPDEII